jgi:ATP-dependent helicase/nuclease subunit B
MQDAWCAVPGQDWAWAWQADPEQAWGEAALQVKGWLDTVGVSPRDARVIVPVGALLPLARRTWARACPGWMPAIDTVAGWAQSVAWLAPAETDASVNDDGDGFPPLTLHPIADRMHLRGAWAKQGWASAWQRRDPKGFDHGLGKVVDMAHAVARRLQAVPPAQRSAVVEQALEAAVASKAGVLAGQVVPGARESVLQQWAVSWAGHAAQLGLAGDALFAQHPMAVVTVVAGGAVSPGTEAHWALSLLAHWQAQGVPVLRLHARPVAVAPVVTASGGELEASAAWRISGTSGPSGNDASAWRPVLMPCSDAEDEAQRACALLIRSAIGRAASEQPGPPAALLALDRSVVRRVRALLDGAGVRVADETGWHLSTTRAASALTRLVRASRPEASTEDWLDWLKSGWLPAVVQHDGHPLDLPSATAALETHCRRHQVLQAWPLVKAAGLPAHAQGVCLWAEQVLAPLQARWQARGGQLAQWLVALQSALQSSGTWTHLLADEAGLAAWQAMQGEAPAAVPEGGGITDSGVGSGARGAGLPQLAKLLGEADLSKAWSGLAQTTRLDGFRFLRWMSDVMEATTFRPTAPEQADVVITTLARAVLRPFSLRVLPGAHLGQLGALDPVDPWLSGALAQALDLSTPASRRAMQWDAWCLLMNQPGMVCLHRLGQGSEALSPSPWLAQWSQARQVAWRAAPDPRAWRAVPAQPVGMPAPVLQHGGAFLPEAVTATAYETLRQCPYRYFATHVLGLREQDELEEGVDHADHGNWLHEVLRCFHERRGTALPGQSAEADLSLWLQCAQDVAASQGLNAEATRPYFAPNLADAPNLGRAYLAWLHPHEAEGWQVRWMEQEVASNTTMADAGVARLTLKGQIDRMDVRRNGPHGSPGDGGAPRALLIDYKTGSLSRLKAKVKAPDEDTQLAFYAQLALAEHTASELEAAYLHIHPDGVTLVPHPDVVDTAERQRQGLAQDWLRLRAGHGMPALGEADACAHCAHAGLCRKAHWSAHLKDMKGGAA